MVERSGLSRAVQQRQRPRRWRDPCSLGTDECPLQAGRGRRRHHGSRSPRPRDAPQARVAGSAQGRQRRLRAGRQPALRHHAVPGAGQLPARPRRRARALDPGAVRRRGGARAPGDPQAQRVRARFAAADGVGAADDAQRPHARPVADRGHRAPRGQQRPRAFARQRQHHRRGRHAAVAPPRHRRRPRSGAARLREADRAGHQPAHRRHHRAHRRPRQRAGAGDRRRRFQSRRGGGRVVQAEPGRQGRRAAHIARQRGHDHRRRRTAGRAGRAVQPAPGGGRRPDRWPRGNRHGRHAARGADQLAQGRDDELRGRQDDPAHHARPSAPSSA